MSLLQIFGGELEKIRLQKLLFLLTQGQEKKSYDFIPFRFGCYSFSANADLTAMVRKGILSESSTHFSRMDKIDYLQLISGSDRNQLMKVTKLYGGLSVIDLMKYTYINFPYWATKSEKAESILSKKELQNVKSSITQSRKTVLFTIGYEGISLEEYFNRLIKNDVKVLVDVRNNPLSMKYGFSKSQLKQCCESLGIQYLHFPEVGIKSEQRQYLSSQSDYDQLFSSYRKNNLTKTKNTQTSLLHLLQAHQRIALTCFEANICQCHRKHLAEAIESLPGFDYEVKHI